MSYINHFIYNVLMQENKKSEIKQKIFGRFNVCINANAVLSAEKLYSPYQNTNFDQLSLNNILVFSIHS